MQRKIIKATVELEAVKESGILRSGKARWEIDGGQLYVKATNLTDLRAKAESAIAALINEEPTPRVAISPGGEVFVMFRSGALWGYGLASRADRDGRIPMLYLGGPNPDAVYRVMVDHALNYD